MSTATVDETELRASHTLDDASADEQAERLLPILREYNSKLVELRRDFLAVHDRCGKQLDLPFNLSVFAGTICLFDTVREAAEKYAMAASGLVEHAPLAFLHQRDLTAQQFELEEYLRQTHAMIASSLRGLGKGVIEKLETQIDNTGRGISPLKKYLK